MLLRLYKIIISAVVCLFTQASAETTTLRRKICAACPARNYNATFQIFACGEYLTANDGAKVPVNERTCGCDISEKTKLKNFHCPKKKW